MSRISQRDQRILRYAGIVIAAYLILFYGRQILEKQRAEYRKLVTQAQNLRQQNLPYASRAETVQKLMNDFRLDPARLKRNAVVGEASAAIQSEAKAGGVLLGPIRESPTKGSGKELATVQMEGAGPVPAVLKFLGSLNQIGYPVVIDSVSLTADNTKPGQTKMSLTLIILDFEQWKGKTPHA